MKKLALIFMFGSLLVTAPAHAAMSDDTRFSNTDGSAKFDDPDEAQSNLSPQTQLGPNDDNNSNSRRPLVGETTFSVSGSSDNMPHNDAFMRGFNRFSNDR